MNTTQGRALTGSKRKVPQQSAGLLLEYQPDFNPYMHQRDAIAEKRRRIGEETRDVSHARGGSQYVKNTHANCNVFESYLMAHWGGRYSLFDASRYPGFDAQDGGVRAEEILADWFNLLTNVKETQGENGAKDVQLRFPFGGYWSSVRVGTTIEDMLVLRGIVYQHLGEGSEHVKNGNTFKKWYTDPQNAESNCMHALQTRFKTMCQRTFARMHSEGGILHNAQDVVMPSHFEHIRIPCTVIHDHLRSLFSIQTKKKIRDAHGDNSCVMWEGGGRAYRSEVMHGELQLYRGKTLLEYRKTLSLTLRNALGYDPTGKPIAQEAFAAALKLVTRATVYRAMSIDDSVMCEMVPHLNLECAVDLQFLTASTTSEALACRISEIYQEQRTDNEFTPDGFSWTLPKSKQDNFGRGITRFVKHRNGCLAAGQDLHHISMHSACARGAEGKLIPETRCAVCLKYMLMKRQGGDVNGVEPTYRKIKAGLKFSFEYEKGAFPLIQEAQFCELAQTIPAFEKQLHTLFEQAVNPARQRQGRHPYLHHKVHWHGFRHGCALNFRNLMPKMTALEIALHCRMGLQVLQVYLSHSQGAHDPSNRTNEISGVMTFSVANVARWCAQQSSCISADAVEAALRVMQLDFTSFVTMELHNLQHFMKAACTVIGAGMFSVLSRSHGHFKEQQTRLCQMDDIIHQNYAQEQNATVDLTLLHMM